VVLPVIVYEVINHYEQSINHNEVNKPPGQGVAQKVDVSAVVAEYPRKCIISAKKPDQDKDTAGYEVVGKNKMVFLLTYRKVLYDVPNAYAQQKYQHTKNSCISKGNLKGKIKRKIEDDKMTKHNKTHRQDINEQVFSV